MIAGNSTILQIAKDTYTGDVPTAATSGFRQIRFSSVSMDFIPNKVKEKVLTGNIGESRSDTLGIKASGSISTLLRPDDAGFFLFHAFGNQELLTDDDVFKFTPHKTNLFSFTLKLDKGCGVYTYPGCVINNLSFSAQPEDYVSLNLDISGYGEEYTSGTLTQIQPSTQRAFKFSQGKVFINNTELADVNSISFSYANNIEDNIQTTSTGLHYKRPSPNTRVITLDIGCLYSSASETFRQNYFKTDNIFSVKLDFQTDEGETDDLHRLTIEIPACQVVSCSVPISDGNSIKQSISLSAVDLGTGELVNALLDNGLEELY